MRTLRPLTTAVLVLILTASVSAATPGVIPYARPWSGPVYAHLHNWDVGTTYIQQFTDGNAAPANVWLQPGGGLAGDGGSYAPLQNNPGNGNLTGEDGWGVVEVDVIYEGFINPAGVIESQNEGNPLWQTGDNGTEVVGAFWNRQDLAVMFTPAGPQAPAGMVIASYGDQVDMFIQDENVFDQSLGSGGRSGTGYAGVGDDLSSRIVLNGYTQSGFHLAVPINSVPPLPCPESIAQFFPTTSAAGHNDLAYSVWDGTEPGAPGVLGGMNSDWDTDFFVGALCPPGTMKYADVALQVTTTANNPGNVSPDLWGPYDWTVTSSDPMRAVPEPATLTLAVVGMAGLLARRRRRR